MTGYAVQRATASGGPWSDIATTSGRSATSFTDSSAPQAGTVYYRVAAQAYNWLSRSTTDGQVSQPVSITLYATNNGYSGSLQTYRVTATGSYSIEAWGAQGGTGSNSGGYSTGGLGAYATGTFRLSAGQDLTVLVGQQGQVDGYGTGGGGGSFVTTGPTNSSTPLVVAGGGGGASNNYTGLNGNTGPNGLDSSADYGNRGPGGTGGYGGGNGCSGGGGGFYGDARVTTSCGSVEQARGRGFPGAGGYLGTCSGPSYGGYGGGGVGGCYGGGGGGGYSGGGGCYHYGYGGGGGSFVAPSLNGVQVSGSRTNNTDLANSGHGRVVITYLG